MSGLTGTASFFVGEDGISLEATTIPELSFEDHTIFLPGTDGANYVLTFFSVPLPEASMTGSAPPNTTITASGNAILVQINGEITSQQSPDTFSVINSNFGHDDPSIVIDPPPM
ncbi:MAG TPA: hypothetical protein VGS22_25615 [Thermoanaerobaculia bacterium]|jgi:hypothetical protein|nr:hypothetical protein [Thermoanaerobaculia bacterium]